MTGVSTVVLLREGMRTTVSLQQEVRGPRQAVAWVVPVPATLAGGHPEEPRVRTLRADALRRIDVLSAPRLVELWEQNPCATPAVSRAGRRRPRHGRRRAYRMTPEAALSSEPSQLDWLGPARSVELAAWLRERGYRVPEGLERAVRTHVAAGMRFVVMQASPPPATTNGVSRTSKSPMAGTWSPPPIQFTVASDPRFVLPMRLVGFGGAGPHHLVLHVLAEERRYEVAGRVNVVVPTNLEMYAVARARFDEVYATLFERVLWRHPGAAVTEYAWPAQWCGTCTTHALTGADLDALGRRRARLKRSARGSRRPVAQPAGHRARGGMARMRARRRRPARRPPPRGHMVMTRLHLVVDPAQPADLRLRPAAPLVGGRGWPVGSEGAMDQLIGHGGPSNAFQARYAILHAFRRRVACPAPSHGRWGSRPHGMRPAAQPARVTPTIIRTGRLRHYLKTWAPVLRIPPRGDAPPASRYPRRPRRRTEPG